MKKAQKEQAEQLIGLLDRVHDGIRMSVESGQKDSAMDLLGQCQEGAISLGEMIEEAEGEDFATVRLLEEYCETVYQFYEKLRQGQSVSGSKVHKSLRKSLIQVKNSVKQDIRVRTEAVFLPYKASMWDSLESVWKAADEDPDCDAYVIPIPYYDKNPDGSFKEEHYEGDQYPKYVPVTWYGDYDFAEHRPDYIFIHNPYDECNYVTSVHPFFYARNLKQYTDKLVYIPYFILQEVDPENTAAVKGMEHFCTTPGVIYADRVIVQSEDMRKVYVNVMTEFAKEAGMTGMDRKYWETKILGLGSPKVDKVLNTKREDLEIPKEWLRVIEKPDGSWKKIVFYNTSVTALLQHGEKMLRKMESVFDIFKENKDETALLWRPHPLIQVTIESMRPELRKGYKEIKDRYIEEGWGIYDDTSDVDRAVAICDGYYGDESSVVELCRKKGIPIMLQSVNVCSKNETILLSTYSIACTENSIYFAAKNIMGFFEYDRQSKITKQISFDAFKMGELVTQFAFGGTCLCKDKVFFAPFAGSKALIYSTDEKTPGQIMDIKQCTNRKKYTHYFIKRAIALDNLIYLVGDACTDILFINMDTMQINVLDSWKMEVSGDASCSGANTRWDVCIVNDALFVPLNYNNHILEINLKTQETRIHKVNSQKILFSTICFDGVYFWLTGTESAVVKWNKADGSVETLKNFPEDFQKFATGNYGEELFSRSFYEKGYVYLFPLTANMVLKIDIKTGQMESLHQWNTLKSCYTVEKWDTDVFYIETLNGNYNDINESLLMDMDGNIVGHNIFTILLDDLQYIFSEKKHQFCMETSAFMLNDFLQRKL